jgi:hypothetical protein
MLELGADGVERALPEDRRAVYAADDADAKWTMRHGDELRGASSKGGPLGQHGVITRETIRYDGRFVK